MQIYQVDAFTKEVFRGNPAAVIPLTQWLPDALLQQIAMENNLAETAYIVPIGDDYEIRWMTPTVEVDLCGHATLASGHVLFEHLGYRGEEITFHTRRAGDLRVKKDKGGRMTMDFPGGRSQRVEADGLGAIFEGLSISPREVYKGPFDYMIVLDSQQQVEALKPDFRKLATVKARGLVVTARGEESDFVSRCFFPQSGIDEDPVTGSAHTMLTPFWAERLGKDRLTAVQLSARRGYLECELVGERVLLSGYAKTFMKGEVFL